LNFVTTRSGHYAGGLLAGKDAETVNGVFHGGLKRRDGRKSGLKLRILSRGVQLGGPTGVETRRHQIQSLARVVNVRARHRQLVL